MRVEELGEGRDEPSRRGAGARVAPAHREDDPPVPLAGIEVPAMGDRKVPDVLRDDRPPFRRTERQKLDIGESSKLIALRRRGDVVTSFVQLSRDDAIVLFIEQKPQRSVLCSLRHAASCSSAAASFDAIRSSISWRLAA